MSNPIRHADGSPDRRYTVNLEYCGAAKPQHVLRFCGEFVGAFRSLPAATLRAVGHRNTMQGGAIVAIEF